MMAGLAVLGDAIDAAPTLGLFRDDPEAEFLFQGATDGAPDRMGCQPVTFISSAIVAPSIRLRRVIRFASFVPGRAAEGVRGEALSLRTRFF